MKPLSSRHRRLDGALGDLPLEEPMLLTELDGYLTGIVVGPERILPGEWMLNVWGPDDGEVPPFEDPLDVRWFADAVMARHDEIVRDLDRGRLQPIFDSDARNGDVFWEAWIDGFAEAMALRPDSWTTIETAPETADAFGRLAVLIDIARDVGTLDSVQINAIEARAPTELTDAIVQLYAARSRDRAPTAGPTAGPRATVGRNDPCPCGSGRKSKRCCG